ncbi:MAG: cysteine hydrolase [Chloroflexi bacterium]|nr:cysteine hydrolase [Chloroflexota bacterium]
MKTLQRVYANPQNAILVIVDMQNEFCKPGGKIYDEVSTRSEVRAQTMPGVISAINSLAQQARNAGIPIIYIQSMRTLQEPEFAIFGMKPYCKMDTWAAEIVEELKPQAGDTVVPKFSHDPFYKTDLERELTMLVPDPTQYYALITGGGINVCLNHAVLGFYLRNYWTVVPVDCIYHVEDMQAALERFSQHAYPSIFLTRSDLIEISALPSEAHPRPVLGT